MADTSLEMTSMLKTEKLQHSSGSNLDYVEKDKRKLRKKGVSRLSERFKENVDLSCRVALGALLVGVIIQLDRRGAGAKDESTSPFNLKIFPSYYYLGGVTYACTMIIFSAGKNLGECLMHAWEGFAGTMIPLIYTYILFFLLPRTQNSLSLMTLTLTGGDYEVSNTDFLRFLPFLAAYAFILLVLPLATNTKKFAVALHILFVLSLINPNDHDNPNIRKQTTVEIELLNLAIYSFIGIFGSIMTLVLMIFPFPRIAIRQFRNEIRSSHEDLGNLLNKIVDSYCYRRKHNKQASYIMLDLKRGLNILRVKVENLEKLIDNIWWEQLVFLHIPFQFHKSVANQYVRLLRRCLEHFEGLQKAVLEEQYDELHGKFMKELQQDIYKLQKSCSGAVKEIALYTGDRDAYVLSKGTMHLQEMPKVHLKLEDLLQKYQELHKSLICGKEVTSENIKNNVTLNVFLFNLASMCEMLIDFESSFNKKNFQSTHRFKEFLRNTVLYFFSKENYSVDKCKAAFKVTLAMTVATAFAVYIYRFDPTVPSAVVYVMGCHVGASFTTTTRRLGGVVAGSVIPNIFKFFICHICDQFISNLLSSTVLFIWVVGSMYPSFDKSQFAYVGYVSAFVAAGLLLAPCSCQKSTTMSYSNLAMNSMGIFIVILFELLIFPSSSYTLAAENIQKTFYKCKTSFLIFFQNDLSKNITFDNDELHDILYSSLPELLKSQQALITEASHEPCLWRPNFPVSMFNSTHKLLKQVYNNFVLMDHIVKWRNRRALSNSSETNSSETNSSKTNSSKTNQEDQLVRVLALLSESNRGFQDAITDTFETLFELFGDLVLVTDTKSASLYIQMKEAFRSADTDNSGYLDDVETKKMLENILAEESTYSQEEINLIVDKFMQRVDISGDKNISLEEFMKALEGGLVLQLKQGNPNSSISPIVRTKRLFETESSILPNLVEGMMNVYVKWVQEELQSKNINVEELLVLNGFIGSIMGISNALTEIETTVITP